ncbi:hypothetical protein AAEY27_00520 [Kosakonia sp. BYX6]|uniref:N-acetyltransferase domain-containing protein n=1 Tax=Kosakonia calanthes TaxID=3139408 RepID=A0ABZ3B5F5_9ENTR
MNVRDAAYSDIDMVCDLLAEAFYDDVLIKSAFPVPERRKDALRSFFRIYGEVALRKGGIIIDENNSGVLMYLHYDSDDISDEIIYKQFQDKYSPDYAAMAFLMHKLSAYHPKTPHYYIFVLAIPGHECGVDVIAALLRRLHALQDKAGIPCYAECTAARVQKLASRLGYRHAGFPLRVEGFPELYPILRDPQ